MNARAILQEVAACKHCDPNRRRSGAGRWFTVNVPASLWERVLVAARQPEGPALGPWHQPAPLAALRLILAAADGAATPDTALPHIRRLARAALGPAEGAQAQHESAQEACDHG